VHVHPQPQAEQESNFLGLFCWAAEIKSVGVVNLAVLACVLRATTKKVVNFFEEKVHPREYPGYAYVCRAYETLP